jgi:hypothetical protein
MLRRRGPPVMKTGRRRIWWSSCPTSPHRANVPGDRAAAGQANQHAGPKRRFGPPVGSRRRRIFGLGHDNHTSPLFLAESKSTTDRTDFTDASDSCHPCHPWSNPFGCGRRPHRSTVIHAPHTRTSSQLQQRRAPVGQHVAASRPTSHERGPTPDLVVVMPDVATPRERPGSEGGDDFTPPQRWAQSPLFCIR